MIPSWLRLYQKKKVLNDEQRDLLKALDAKYKKEQWQKQVEEWYGLK